MLPRLLRICMHMLTCLSLTGKCIMCLKQQMRWPLASGKPNMSYAVDLRYIVTVQSNYRRKQGSEFPNPKHIHHYSA